MAYPVTHQEPFTMVPNIYFDRIMPLLTDTQRIVCDVVIRETIGWHRDSAAISNTKFKVKTGKSEPAIIRAKKALEEIALLVVLQEGGGSQTGEYALDFYYDNPDRSIRASLLEQNELIEEDTSETQDNAPRFLEAPGVDEDPQPEMDDMDCEVALDPEVDTEDSFTPNATLVPSIRDNNNIIIYNKNKHIANTDDEAKDRRKEATATVCFLLKSWETELEPNDYAFVGWCLKEYGIEAVNEKIQILKFQRNRGVKFSNPLGWLRSALARDYRYSRWDCDVMKAKERAEKESERSKLEQAQREREIREMERLREEAGEIKNQLVPEDREDLRRTAIEQLLGMDGMTQQWINEPLIESVENKILRERVVD